MLVRATCSHLLGCVVLTVDKAIVYGSTSLSRELEIDVLVVTNNHFLEHNYFFLQVGFINAQIDSSLQNDHFVNQLAYICEVICTVHAAKRQIPHNALSVNYVFFFFLI